MARTGIYIYFERDGKTFVAKPVTLDFVEISQYGTTDGPTIGFDMFQVREFLVSIAAELDKNDIKKPSEDKVYDLLEAKNDHLQDMRKLLKLKKGER
jgi:hypothetical protein